MEKEESRQAHQASPGGLRLCQSAETFALARSVEQAMPPGLTLAPMGRESKRESDRDGGALVNAEPRSLSARRASPTGARAASPTRLAYDQVELSLLLPDTAESFSSSMSINDAGPFPSTSLSRETGPNSGNKPGLTQYAALQPTVNQACFPCHPLPCERPSRPPRWDVTPTTHYDGSVTI